MKQVFAHYLEWEDYQNGMYKMPKLNDGLGQVQQAKELLSNTPIFFDTMKIMMKEWPVCSAVNLTNLGQNRRAWLGAAACNYLHKIPEVITRIAWNELSKEQQDKANLAANKIINEYDNHQQYAQTLFDIQCA